MFYLSINNLIFKWTVEQSLEKLIKIKQHISYSTFTQFFLHKYFFSCQTSKVSIKCLILFLLGFSWIFTQESKILIWNFWVSKSKPKFNQKNAYSVKITHYQIFTNLPSSASRSKTLFLHPKNNDWDTSMAPLHYASSCLPCPGNIPKWRFPLQ